MTSTAELKHVLAPVLTAERMRTPNHPSPDLLLSYDAGLLAEVEEEEVRVHLVHCEVCRQALLDLARFEEVTRHEPPDLPEPELDAAWSRMRHRVEGSRPERRSSTAVPTAPSNVRPFSSPTSRRTSHERPPAPRRLQLLAACTSILAVGLGASTLYFRGAAQGLACAIVNPPRVVLKPLTVTRSEGSAAEATVSSSARRFLVTFDSVLLSRLPEKVPVELCATFESASLEATQRICGALERKAVDRFSMSLSRDIFPAGHYTVKLAKTVPPPEELLEQYTMTIQ